MALRRDELEAFLTDFLRPEHFVDHGPNGLQIEGNERIEKVAFAVSATVESITQAVAWLADALIVHHGLLWRFHGVRPIVGPVARRILPLARAGINLFGYHLPLDAHLEVGNAAGLARRLGMQEWAPFPDPGTPMGVQGRLVEPRTAGELQAALAGILDHPVLLSSPDQAARIATLGIVTGGANDEWRLAAEAGLDAYLTGEMSEHDWHDAKEAGVHMFAGGHNATEQFGVQDLMARIADRFPGLQTRYLHSPNPA